MNLGCVNCPIDSTTCLFDDDPPAGGSSFSSHPARAVHLVLELITPRLRLRRLHHNDASAIASYRGLPEVAQFQSWEEFDLADAVRLIAEQNGIEPNTPGTWLQLAITSSEPSNVVGDCGIHFRSDDCKQVELGITLDPKYQRCGLATEALNCILPYVFDQLGKHRIVAVTDVENLRAASLFRRTGFRQEAHFVEHVWYKGAWGSEYLFALLRREWQDGLG